jgi:hypothetical protein
LEGVEGEGLAGQEAALPMSCYIVPCFRNSQRSMPATVTQEGVAYSDVVLVFPGFSNLVKVLICDGRVDYVIVVRWQYNELSNV